ncbi:MAG: hypothetical protein KKG43_06580 [Candidatus Omnitrophica bacterium]|nr:hypothetical protein [Candidatus Omnitrophota bacterium]MBU1928905.1 hypothetical protein [Candidatus Omnitrophota bacterium]MBU2034631.1 hypothetical protein [Candidatus Omnitrophota bacterium]MBU2257516.1 hypothetical protein [Candidatus Omnitrophota bacterium]
MNYDQINNKLTAYFNLNFGFFPATAEMASIRYLKKYLAQKNKEEITEDDLPELGRWLADKFMITGIISEAKVKKMIQDFNQKAI